jgi:Fe-S cluster assembly scaffold protein SufB
MIDFELIKQNAQRAQNRPSSYGSDIFIDHYEEDQEHYHSVGTLGELPDETQKKIHAVGMDDELCRAGSFFQFDESVLQSLVRDQGIEIMPLTDALEKYEWLDRYYWQAVAVDKDKYTAWLELHPYQGYFIRALPHSQVELPIQSCLYLGKDNIVQNVHNIIIAEEGSTLQIITGCAADLHVQKGLHIGASEIYIKSHASVIYTMIHDWAPETVVRPRTGIILDDNALFISNYISLKPLKDLQMNPVALCQGRQSKAIFNTLLIAHPGSFIDAGSIVHLSGAQSTSEIVSRVITKGGKVITRGTLVGETSETKGHIECMGLILSDKGIIHAIPELEGRVEGLELSHEASVGKIAEEELAYLMARGFTPEQATSTIIRGFLDADIIKGLPDTIKSHVKKIMKISEKYMM